ncbi:MAG: VOC family protein [Actinomycetota bacterium]
MSTTLGYVSFYVPDVAAALRFYVEAFGLEQRFLTPENDYGELATGETTLSFVAHGLAGDNLAAAGGFTPLDTGGAPVGAGIVLVTDDVPTAVEAALAAGARPYTDPVDKPWGQTVAYVIDPSGILVELATPVAAT